MDSALRLLDGVTVTPLKQVRHPKGDIYHALKCSEDSFVEFGEAYFTTIHQNDIKGWKQHTRMLMNLVVPVGLVGFHFYNEKLRRNDFLAIGQNNYARITVQPGIWMAFQGMSEELNLVLNLASIPHDPEEAINVDLSTYPLIKEVDSV